MRFCGLSLRREDVLGNDRLVFFLFCRYSVNNFLQRVHLNHKE